jgi:hypothetical protein
MNNVFKKQNRIDLEEGMYLTPDGFRGIVLNIETAKTRKKIDKQTKKPTGEEEQYIHTETFYYPKLSQTINKYLQLKTCEAKSVEELKEIVLRVEKTINDKLINDFN